MAVAQTAHAYAHPQQTAMPAPRPLSASLGHPSPSRKRQRDMTPDDFGLRLPPGAVPRPKRRKTPTKTPSPAFSKPITPAIAPASAPGVNVVVCLHPDAPAATAMAGGAVVGIDAVGGTVLPGATTPSVESESEHEGLDPLEHWLTHVQVLTGAKANKILEVQAYDTVVSAFRTLITARLLSAPIYDAHTSTYVGTIDIVDLVHMAVNSLSKVTSRVSLENLMRTKVFGMKVFQLANFSSLNPFVAVKLGSSILKVMQGLAVDKLHRVSITDDKGRVRGIISQSWMVRWLSTNAQRFLGERAHAPIADLGLGEPKTVVTIRDSQLAIEAFSAMVEASVSAVGIVDSHNVLKGVISVRDIKAVRPSQSNPDVIHFDALYINVMEFVAVSRAQVVSTEKVPLLSCSPDTPLTVVLGRVVAARMYRIFVVDEMHRPVSVVSLADLIRVFLPPSASSSLIAEATASANATTTVCTTTTSSNATTTVSSITVATTSATPVVSPASVAGNPFGLHSSSEPPVTL
ncbi:uncharacterized protein AMSG_01365 [Thecamonas trahens ATCC 50062]|uniref:CBS domain-containing protein n=1 Tax=Thecamonas trahens ATCC 50062 TaxID=461836 RepID=A0A0L0DNS5_THETB|nr:hypothetical protein AMSG_01365 [Thecamonas trahens ATCC 50062]KNC53656.1 hypothetical protein AMSG_01365 [Thecamonas trahens ATCC 50062]|eukprot:XP_013761971.1 hypothetical protein AMSG_01365 [Thecamonas trahens ATCC 50062]